MSKKYKQTVSGNGKIEIANCAFRVLLHRTGLNVTEQDTLRIMQELSCPAYACKIDGLQDVPHNCKRKPNPSPFRKPFASRSANIAKHLALLFVITLSNCTCNWLVQNQKSLD